MGCPLYVYVWGGGGAGGFFSELNHQSTNLLACKIAQLKCGGVPTEMLPHAYMHMCARVYAVYTLWCWVGRLHGCFASP